MQIRTLNVNNFKSLVDFKLDLAKFTCLIGLNGAGKSTVLQFIDFLAQQVRGDIKGWLRTRSWDAKDIFSQFTEEARIEFSVCLKQDSGELATWEAEFDPVGLRCTRERIVIDDTTLEVHAERVRVQPSDQGRPLDQEIAFRYEGSILSQLRESTLPPRLVEVKRFCENVNSLGVMSPELLRQRTRTPAESLGLGGRGLPAVLHKLGAMERDALAAHLRKAYKQLRGMEIKSLRRGWKKLDIQEEFDGTKLVTDAHHVADGLLRLIAVLAETQTEHRFLLFDEIENGINPEVVEFVLDALVSAPQQVLVTTHSPLILNYLSDDVARSGVIYLYKTRKGHTRAIPFFSIPSIAEKLTVMGPGEAFADTDLTHLQDEIEAVTEGK